MLGCAAFIIAFLASQPQPPAQSPKPKFQFGAQRAAEQPAQPAPEKEGKTKFQFGAQQGPDMTAEQQAGWEAFGALAVKWKASQYSTSASGVEVVSGWIINTNHEVFSEKKKLPDGNYFIQSTEKVTIGREVDGKWVYATFPPRAMIHVGEHIAPPMVEVGKLTCGDGYYPCCVNDLWGRCVSNDDKTTCKRGGAGAVSCPLFAPVVEDSLPPVDLPLDK